MFAILLDVSVGLALALLFRRPAQRLFGAGPAFTLWLLPPLFAALPLLPAPPASWSLTPALLVMPSTPALFHQADAAVAGVAWYWLGWIAGTLAGFVRLALGYRQLLRQLEPVPDAMWRDLQNQLDGLPRHRLRLHTGGPAALWWPRALLLLPEDFLQRFDAVEQRLILRHEQTHMRRGDPLWSLLAQIMSALLWCHPLVWFALPRFRLDQELACDESVLQEWPQDEARYAHTLLHSTGHASASVLNPWL